MCCYRDFLLGFRRNCVSVLYCFHNIAKYSKLLFENRQVTSYRHWVPHLGVNPFEFHKGLWFGRNQSL